jgi:hypothetical protein
MMSAPEPPGGAWSGYAGYFTIQCRGAEPLYVITLCVGCNVCAQDVGAGAVPNVR